MQQIRDHQRLKHIQFEMTARSTHCDSGVIAHDLRAHHRHRLTLGRVDLPRHDGAAGLVLGQRDFAQP